MITYKYISVVPPLTGHTPNPEMYCNLARENTMVERCIDCKNTECKHVGKKTVLLQEKIVFGG